MTKSLSFTYISIFNGFDIIVLTLPSNKSSNSSKRLGLTSKIVTSAPKPKAILAAFVPAWPPPIIVTLPLGTPGMPPSKIPIPPLNLCKNSAPTCVDILPATSLIGVNNGKEPSGNCTVS